MSRLLVLVPALAALVAWQIGSITIGNGAVPGPLPVASAIWFGLQSEPWWGALGQTAARTVLSFLIAGILGVVIGILPGEHGPFRRGIDILVDFMRSIPGPALLPVFMTLFGLYSGPKIALAVFVCTLINVVYTGTGIKLAAKSLRVSAARSFGASRTFVFTQVIIPGALELIIGGLRVTLSLALVLTVLSELVLMTGEGLGVLIRIAYEDRRLPEMYGAIAVSGCFGTLLNAVFAVVERRTTWYRGADAQREYSLPR